MERVSLDQFTSHLKGNIAVVIKSFVIWYEAKQCEDPDTWGNDLTWLEWQHAFSAFLLESTVAFEVVTGQATTILPPAVEPLPLPLDLAPPPLSSRDELDEWDQPPPLKHQSDVPEEERPPCPPWARVQGRE